MSPIRCIVIIDVLDAVRQGRAVEPAVVDPITAALIRNARSMIDVDYAAARSSSTTGGRSRQPGGHRGPRPGQRYPD
jgi:hypothetical protein